MRNFTLGIYKKLLQVLVAGGCSFQSLEGFIRQPAGKAVIFRHDVDRLPGNALVIAEIEKKVGIKASYYFRIVKQSYNEDIIRQIAGMGHEIGYHYEDLSLCKGDDEAAIRHFEVNLEKFRKIYPVKTICMHGSPLSRWDNRDLWKKYDYRDFGIIAEPYFDIDFNDVFYLTDTGRRWDGSDVSVRDKVAGKGQNAFDNLKFQSTMDIIEAAKNGLLPDRVMINTHPQRWDDRFVPWAKELVWQNAKNIVKKLIVSCKGAKA
ncbi:hypothetical protein [Desulfobacula sp.]|uniref:hypothetical protein n=1 Tax=Desulfobacula sp. TaxID=2593537 RepID=UPI0025BBF485|nr:hypothetical protein [Desulfobacula sp.]MBC2704221.1 hypothetical protein [Desulfobacula sp.]